MGIITIPVMSEDSTSELLGQITRLLDQATDDDDPVLPRITASITAGQYLEALNRRLVADAREHGHSWQEIAEVFSTSPVAVEQRFGSLRRYDD